MGPEARFFRFERAERALHCALQQRALPELAQGVRRAGLARQVQRGLVLGTCGRVERVTKGAVFFLSLDDVLLSRPDGLLDARGTQSRRRGARRK